MAHAGGTRGGLTPTVVVGSARGVRSNARAFARFFRSWFVARPRDWGDDPALPLASRRAAARGDAPNGWYVILFGSCSVYKVEMTRRIRIGLTNH